MSVSNLQCTIACRECWKPVITMQYDTVENVTIISAMSQDCNTNFDCVDQYFEAWQVNQTSTCFYNPQSTSEFATTNEYSPDKFGAMYTFAILSIISGILCFISLFIVLPIQLMMGYGMCRRRHSAPRTVEHVQPISEEKLSYSEPTTHNNSEPVPSEVELGKSFAPPMQPTSDYVKSEPVAPQEAPKEPHQEAPQEVPQEPAQPFNQLPPPIGVGVAYEETPNYQPYPNYMPSGYQEPPNYNPNNF